MNETTPANEPPHQTFEVGVKALVFRMGRLLLLKRSDVGAWEMPGGRMNVGEQIEDTLLRELAEELPNAGRFVVGDVVHAQPTNFTLSSGHRLMLVYLKVQSVSELPDDIVFAEEHSEALWVTRQEFDDLDLEPQVRAAGTRGFDLQSQQKIF